MTQQVNRIAIDIGGAFINLAVVDGDTLELEKTSIIPTNLANGVLTVVGKSALDPVSLDQFVHGTTVVINAITEWVGQEVVLLTTTGSRDVLDITRANRPDMFDYQYKKSEPFIPQRHRWEVDERVDQVGPVLTPFDEDGVREAVREMRAKGLDTVTVCYVHGYENPEHE